MNDDEFKPVEFPPPKRTEPARLYLISPQEVGGAFPDRLKAALEGGEVAAFQMRVKDTNEHQLARLAEPLQRLCGDHDCAFIVNDSMALAKRLGADGVHLGQSDGDPREARALLGQPRRSAARATKPPPGDGSGRGRLRLCRLRRFLPDYHQALELPARAGNLELVVERVRNSMRRHWWHHPGQRPALARCRR
jgi:hypothetical protein